MHKEDIMFIGGVIATLLALWGIDFLFEQPVVHRVSCSFSNAEVPEGSFCVIRSSSRIEKLFTKEK